MNALIGALSAVVVLIAGFFVVGPVLNEPPLGAVAGPEHGEHQFFMQGATSGGNVFASTSQGTATYLAASFKNASLIQHTASAALTVTLPASSTLSDFAIRAGDTRTIYLAPITNGITVAGGTGTDLDTASSTKYCVVSQVCRLDFVRKTNTDFEVLLTNPSGI